jgi:RND family efflux transporter MFP subunit
MNKLISNYRISFTAVVILAVLFLGSCSEDQRENKADVSVPVSVMEIKTKSIEKYLNTTGTVAPLKEVELKAQIAGKYELLINPKTKKPYALGDKISEGQTIIRIHDEEYVNNIKLEAQKLNLEISKQTVEKQRSLYEKGGVTLNDLKRAEVDLVNAEYSYKDAQLRMNKLDVKAPFSGVIVDLPSYTNFTQIDMGNAMFKLMDYNTLLMDIKLPEKDLADITTELEVRIMNYTIPDDTLQGVITQLSPAIDPETRTFKGKIKVFNPELLLRPGMFVKADIVVSRKENAIVLPKDIILQRGEGKVVFVVAKGEAKRRVLSTGLENPEEIEIVAGLELNDRVVTKGFETLRDESNIKIMQ